LNCTNDVRKAHLRQINQRFIEIKNNLEELNYWTKENELGVIELVKENIQKNFSIIQKHLKYLSNQF